MRIFNLSNMDRRVFRMKFPYVSSQWLTPIGHDTLVLYWKQQKKQRKEVCKVIHVGELKEELIQYAKEIGVDKIRFASADTFDSLKDRLILHESLGCCQALKSLISKKNKPFFAASEGQINCCNSARVSFQNERCSSKYKGCKKRDFCRASWGTDYHVVLKKSLICSKNSCGVNMSIYGQNQWWTQGNYLIVQ